MSMMYINLGETGMRVVETELHWAVKKANAFLKSTAHAPCVWEPCKDKKGTVFFTLCQNAGCKQRFELDAGHYMQTIGGPQNYETHHTWRLSWAGPLFGLQVVDITNLETVNIKNSPKLFCLRLRPFA